MHPTRAPPIPTVTATTTVRGSMAEVVERECYVVSVVSVTSPEAQYVGQMLQSGGSGRSEGALRAEYQQYMQGAALLLQRYGLSQKRTHTHTNTHTYEHTIHTNARARAYTHMHTLSHTHTHTHIHTHLASTACATLRLFAFQEAHHTALS